MREFQAKKRFRRLLYSKLSIAVLVILIILLLRGLWGVYQKERESAEKAALVQSQLKTLQARYEVLNSSINRLQTNEGVEEVIRSKYSVSKPGENVVVIVDATSSQAAAVQAKESWWDKFKQLFK